MKDPSVFSHEATVRLQVMLPVQSAAHSSQSSQKKGSDTFVSGLVRLTSSVMLYPGYLQRHSWEPIVFSQRMALKLANPSFPLVNLKVEKFIPTLHLLASRSMHSSMSLHVTTWGGW